MKDSRNGFYTLIFSTLVLMVTLFSCKENDVKKVNTVTKTDISPSQNATNLKVDYTENGKLVYTMISPEMRKFDQPEQKTEFPKGFNVVFYDSLGHQKGTARANYALSHDVTQIIELRGNVIIQNFKDKTKIETEKMFWNRATKQIYGDKAVRILTADRIFTAIGFKSNEDLTQRELLHPTGSWWVKDL